MEKQAGSSREIRGARKTKKAKANKKENNKEEMNNFLLQSLGEKGLQSLMENYTSVSDTGFSDHARKPVIMFFIRKCLMIPQDKKYVDHIFLEEMRGE